MCQRKPCCPSLLRSLTSLTAPCAGGVLTVYAGDPSMPSQLRKNRAGTPPPGCSLICEPWQLVIAAWAGAATAKAASSTRSPASRIGTHRIPVRPERQSDKGLAREALAPAVLRAPAEVARGLGVGGAAGARHHRQRLRPGGQPHEPGWEAPRRRGAELLGQHRQPLGGRRRVVVDDVVDPGRATAL